MSEPYSASGSFLDAKSQSTGPQTTTSDILFLKRLLFLKAALDNEASSSNFAIPFDEDKAFRVTSHETNQPQMIGNGEKRQGAQTAPAGQGRRPRIDNQFNNLNMLEDDLEEKPLALTNGGYKDDLDDS